MSVAWAVPIDKGRAHLYEFSYPRPVADLLAQLVYIPTVDKADKTDNDKRIYDPCCGSGGLILACARKDRNRYFVAADISYTCCLDRKSVV